MLRQTQIPFGADPEWPRSADGYNLRGQHGWVLGSCVPSGPHDLHVPETGLPELITESDRLLRAGHSREPVGRSGSSGAFQRGLQDQLRSKDRASGLQDPRKFEENLVAKGIQVEDAVNQDVID